MVVVCQGAMYVVGVAVLQPPPGLSCFSLQMKFRVGVGLSCQNGKLYFICRWGMPCLRRRGEREKLLCAAGGEKNKSGRACARCSTSWTTRTCAIMAHFRFESLR